MFVCMSVGFMLAAFGLARQISASLIFDIGKAKSCYCYNNNVTAL